MHILFQYLQKYNLFEKITISTIIQNFSTVPNQIITQVNQHPSKFKSYIQSAHTHNATPLQKLTLINQIIIHSGQFYEQFGQLDLNFRCADPWLNTAVFIPFPNFLRKVMHSQEMYQKVRIINLCWNRLFKKEGNQVYKSCINRNPKEYLNLKLVYYIINLMNDLFETLKNTPTLGRYYLSSHRSEVQPFVEMASLQAVALYFALKFIIQQILLDYDYYITSKTEGEAFKQIMFHDLQSINQKMKQALLSKYFELIQKGIKIQLFEVERQGSFYHSQVSKLIEDYGSSRRKRNVLRNEMKLLEEKIFGESKFDNRLFEESTTLFTNRKFHQQTTQDCDQKQNNRNAANLTQIQPRKATTGTTKIKRASRKSKSKDITTQIVNFLTNQTDSDL